MDRTLGSRCAVFLVVFISVTLTRNGRAAPFRENSSSEPSKTSQAEAIGVLMKYGYLQKPQSEGTDPPLLDEASFIAAIKAYQGFNGLEETGRLDSKTLTLMSSPRCGVPENSPGGLPPTTGERPQPFTTIGSKWKQGTITWKPTRFSDLLSPSQQMKAFRKAFGLWAEAIPNNFTYTDGTPDIQIFFAKGEHGDGKHNKFNGPGGVLAHAYSPGSGIGGDTHFDAEEPWSEGTGQGVDLTTVAAHEFGHALGLGHSSVPSALMAPYYVYRGEATLHADDILGIQIRYGVRPTTSTTPPTTTTTTTTTTTSTKPTPTPEVPDFCNERFRVDAITEGGDGYMYVFRLDKVYKVNQNGLVDGYPKSITEVFAGAPRRHVKAASFVPETRKVYLFKGLSVWRFSAVPQGNGEGHHQSASFQVDEGYPKLITVDAYYTPSAALTLTYKGVSQVFLFSWDYFWEWDVRSERIVPGYPLASKAYFPHAPGLPDAALMNSKGNILFFKYNIYKFLHHRGLDGEPQTLTSDLFGPVCGGESSKVYQQAGVIEKVQALSGLPPQADDAWFSPQDAKPQETTEEMQLSPQLWTLVLLRQVRDVIPLFAAKPAAPPSTHGNDVPPMADSHHDNNDNVQTPLKTGWLFAAKKPQTQRHSWIFGRY